MSHKDGSGCDAHQHRCVSRSCCRGEIKKLQLKAIDLDKNEILIPRFVNIDGKKSTATKTKKGNRRVVLDTLAVWAVRKLMSRAKRLGATEPTHFLLPTLLDKHTKETDPLHGGEGYDPTHPQASWSWEWEALCEALSLRHRFHNLRHTYITRCAEAGLPIEVVMSQVGHMSAAMSRHYTHISTRALHRAASQLDTIKETASKLGLTVYQFRSTRSRLRILYECFEKGLPIPKRKNRYKKAKGRASTGLSRSARSPRRNGRESIRCSSLPGLSLQGESGLSWKRSPL